jgi:hypothetical protein
MEMVNLFLILTALAGCGSALVKYLGEALRDPAKEALKKRFED